MIRYRVYFSLGGYLIVHAASIQEAADLCAPMLSPGESLSIRPEEL